ncbi:histidine--tRNA ligase [Microaerobacter geothermalis]|uniref:histidine--tRNA ligase n=1 Tax=Microaerobacter geothermalis TaxID=674972 RepID=UPI001F030637|nr:histidine--tRNA ligase [Microaerobacter geothermalis]MCF6092771.1 histidine--tRNA ligase [Microaerobacter geothermalis]
MNIRIPRGTADVLPGEVEKWQIIEDKARDLFHRYHYQEIRTPMFEYTELFLRGVGETTDIVEKEMYTFLDKGERSITLRPEGTASVVRSFVENKMYGNPQQPTKLYYIGPMFRYERPQAGRTRQFTQIGLEALGSDDPSIDVEVIALALSFYEELGISNLHVEINSVGCPDCRPIHREALVSHLLPYRDKLCKDCQSRLERNPMRILDCKVESCKELTKDAPSVLEHLCEDCDSHFQKVKDYLKEMGISYVVNPRMVRGLDYYTRTAFEIMETRIGAVGTLCGGGRYNGLVEEIGGPPVPGIGFALSIERVLLALEAHQVNLPIQSFLDVYLAIQTEHVKGKAVALIQKLRAAGFSADMDYMNRKMKAQIKSADRFHAKWVCIFGEEEMSRGNVLIKDMATGEQEEAAYEQVLHILKEKIMK